MNTDSLVRGLLAGDAHAIRELRARAPTSDDVTLLVAAALTSDGWAALLDRAGRLAAGLPDRQLVTIARAHLGGDDDRARLLARDHLAEHPESLLVAHIATATSTRRTP
ncbi:MAG: hypothetical protein J0I34_23425 [Pseudonocardia sp.]|uniref:hypothetical protein n=1 Tax=unclassified Pseudonocardia TaxID=2619320 RepID=UPI0008698032|nr:MULTISPECIES: hypothetical protein [unclassified Pseudonocardia]MBN9111723.1 hypothetical protein [Pseudonocardia sp.]ODU25542.1 MAG: hypothetical protein ABS80_09785 [Pseudonocardia sp. SCN 72-51]ODV02305.1 MAG: hypothetical protein ABT15_25860 [Pseudonocardia sp. SCN 73-27]